LALRSAGADNLLDQGAFRATDDRKALRGPFRTVNYSKGRLISDTGVAVQEKLGAVAARHLENDENGSSAGTNWFQEWMLE
jgi:hypothetical protein